MCFSEGNGVIAARAWPRVHVRLVVRAAGTPSGGDGGAWRSRSHASARKARTAAGLARCQRGRRRKARKSSGKSRGDGLRLSESPARARVWLAGDVVCHERAAFVLRVGRPMFFIRRGADVEPASRKRGRRRARGAPAKPPCTCTGVRRGRSRRLVSTARADRSRRGTPSGEETARARRSRSRVARASAVPPPGRRVASAGGATA